MTVPTQPGLAATIESPNPEGNGAQSPIPSSAAFQHGASGERTFTESDLQRMRDQEKDKLYSEMKSLKDQWADAQKVLKDIEQQRAQELAEADRIREEKELLSKAKKEDEMSAKALLEARLKETNETWESRFDQLNKERETERALVAKERAYNELVDYRNSRIAEDAENIAPQFHPFITGETKDQIDQAIAQAKSATQSIAEEVAAARTQQLSQMRGVSTNGYSSMGPLEGSIGQKNYSQQDIIDMPMSEWAKVREDTGIARSDVSRNRGILG